MIPGRDYLSFEFMRELAHGVAAVIDDIERLNSLQRAASKNAIAALTGAIEAEPSVTRAGGYRSASTCEDQKLEGLFPKPRMTNDETMSKTVGSGPRC